MKPTDDELRMLRDTYAHCRRWAHACQVGTNRLDAVLAALDELLERRATERAAAAIPTDIP